MSIMNISNK